MTRHPSTHPLSSILDTVCIAHRTIFVFNQHFVPQRITFNTAYQLPLTPSTLPARLPHHLPMFPKIAFTKRVLRSLLMGPAHDGTRGLLTIRSWEGLWARFAPECRGLDELPRNHQQLWPHSLAERLPHEKRLRGPSWFSSMCKALSASPPSA